MRLILFILLVLSSSLTHALDPLLSLRIGEAESKLKVIEDALKDPQSIIQPDVLSEFQEQQVFVRNTSNECIDNNEKAINRSADDLDLLGSQALLESADVSLKRQSLNQSMLSNAQQLASCRLLLLRSHETMEMTLERQKKALTGELLAQQNNLFENFKNVILNPAQILTAGIDFIEGKAGLQNIIDNAVILSLIVGFSLMVIVLLKRWLKASLKSYNESNQQGYFSQFQISLIACLNRYLLTLILTAVLSLYFIYFILVESSWYFSGLVIIGIFLYTILSLTIRVLLNPCPPGQRFTRLSEDISRLLARRLRLLSKLLLAGFLMYSALEIHDFPVQITALLRNVYLILLVLNLIWAIWLFRFYEGVSNVLLLRSLIIVGLLGCLVADWLGYVNLAMYILLAITGSILLWTLTTFIIRIWTDFLDSMDEGRTVWQQRFRKFIGVKSDEYIPGSIWFRFTFAIISWSIFLVAFLKIWGFPDSSLISLKDNVIEGFDIGTVRIEPLKIVIAVLTFAVMLSIVGWVKRRMDKSWLSRSRMDRGTKEAMISLTGYFGVAVAFLIGLSIAGFELANIALIAGALSVGIGFGLQNIVNNFVSGVILLFERPIKTGDWIVVGGTEGYVKKISIRSTQIQTFDRADIMVPNSELISSQVTNWMFRDSIGRIIVPIGVAYGTDPEKVKEILLDIAYQHDSIISQSPILAKPWVFFKEFGDSSLNFELRCFIKVADDCKIVTSDINFELEKALRKANIEIPFPQRDVHLISKD
ncbi:MAG: mechanosensitive ion channel family protein [Gammaproteobacteria bacterium]|jgi:small-conductance mechanosensitive channel|nr:mechanosensitive ion channel family protein [Gammaproteobacteria bacterium]MBT3725835.1 mechanosensitive ion channel family protein [Gammaproteobacteria bacterium]MBT4195714.1 mechanosensitive ion channel family protein [Gammaproteobacteria bacterium]MBT4450791.1 mechanosensitive ion channel family protein [Gammaproteobacteria bacterium]MBT4860495.1 mechanosensitive ion channel family protein [Gammaproteobacteria bacterium]